MTLRSIALSDDEVFIISTWFQSGANQANEAERKLYRKLLVHLNGEPVQDQRPTQDGNVTYMKSADSWVIGDKMAWITRGDSKDSAS